MPMKLFKILLIGEFLFFDAPIVYFGFGEYDRVGKVEVVWSMGKKTT